ncbi:MAG: hypothetical protein HGB12_11545 [Bacteroidetes bacterium]|nr:hypothetical protein [Bacteroidota bacterium]
MRTFLILIFSIIMQLSFANMASPIREGTISSSAFSSRDIDIFKEKIHIAIDKEYKTAAYVIEYFIKTDVDGKQIPLLFHARGYKGDFKIWVDNQEVKLLDIPSEYRTTYNAPFEKFSSSFRLPSRQGESETVVIYWEKNSGFVYELNDLKYFEANLTKGEHKIRIEYTAKVWTDVSDWVKKYSFRYSLSPAKNWKSFGSLEIILDVTAFNSLLTTNIGQPTIGKLDSVAIWNFSKLPADYFEIIYTPKISGFAKALIVITPVGLTVIIAILIVLLHFFSIKKFRKNEPTKKYSWVVIAGSIVIPFLILIIYMISYVLIDNAIGKEASSYHGYTFLILILYPLLLPIYWLIMWWTDRIIKRKINNAL